MLILRSMTPEDAPLVVSYIKELADYERDPDAAVVTPEDILHFAFSDHPSIVLFVRACVSEVPTIFPVTP